MSKPSIVWFRRDLRLADHPALAAALAEGDVVPLFVVDPAFDGAGAPRRALLHDSLQALDTATGRALVIRHGDPVDEVPAIAEEIGADSVYVSKDFAPYGRRRDEQVADVLRGAGRRLHGVGSPYAVEPGSVRKDDGNPYAVFTPFSRKWRSYGWQPPIDAPSSPNWRTAPSDGLPQRPGIAIELPSVAEDQVAALWGQFRENGLDWYAQQRDLPAMEGTSRLSPYLKYGLIHPRQLMNNPQPRGEGEITFQSELAWRDFYADVLFHRPETAWRNLNAKFDDIVVDTGPPANESFRLWCEGRTGFPIVDAGMRQLMATGWMHNRVRMIVASFLVKDLHLPWQWGAQFFLQHLLDGDLASNNHGWQWAAGTGTDAAPYFRVFNPTAQQKRWDPDGDYVQRWIPELGTSAYPEQIVDHGIERQEALDRYQAIKGR